MDTDINSPDIRQSGEVNHRFEVTSEMIEAGWSILYQFDPDIDDISHTVEKLYLACDKARKRTQ